MEAAVSALPVGGSKEQEPRLDLFLFFIFQADLCITLEILRRETPGRTGLPAIQVGEGTEPSYTETFLFGKMFYLQNPPSWTLSRICMAYVKIHSIHMTDCTFQRWSQQYQPIQPALLHCDLSIPLSGGGVDFPLGI